jgi:hypothetical protein
MIVSWPFSAPAWPPDTGASTNQRPTGARRGVHLAGHGGRGGGVVDDHAALAHRRQHLRHDVADVVVIAHAQADQLGARHRLGDGRPDAPPCFSTQRAAFSGVRLKTVTSWPAAFRWPAIGKPITPRPINAVFMPRTPLIGTRPTSPFAAPIATAF